MRRVLNYPGSKWKIANALVELIPKHHSYVEPFFGSGAVLFSKTPSDIETINDLDSNVTNLFECIREDAEKLAGLVVATPYSREVYDNQFESEPTDCYERAVWFLILCWQGYGYRTNKYKVGWKNDVSGRERAYALRNWYRLPEWILEISERLRMVQIENRPAIEVIQRFDFDNVFMYLDPPYLLHTRSGARKQYKHEMTDTEHEELLKVVVKSRAKIMISGYESDMYNEYLRGWKKMRFRGCAQNGTARDEVVWMNYEISSTIRSF